jgi:ABC-2 type transport system permease protein
VSVGALGSESVLGRPLRGPSALGGSPARFLYLTRTLAVTDFKLKFFGSALGYLWQLMRPLMLFGVLYVVFTQVVRLGNDVAFYPAVLLTGIVLYTFFAEATGGAVTCVVDRENLVRKIHFPRLVVPLAGILTAYFNLLLNLVAVLVFVFASGVGMRLSWLELPLLLLILGVLCAGIAMLLSALYVRFRDVKPIWDVMLQIAFYSSPVLYAIETVPSEKLQHALMLNPLGAIIQQARHAIIDPEAPSAAAAAGGWELLLIPCALVVGLFALGFWVFNREAPRIAEEL